MLKISARNSPRTCERSCRLRGRHKSSGLSADVGFSSSACPLLLQYRTCECTAAKRRFVPKADSRTAANLCAIRPPGRRWQAASAAECHSVAPPAFIERSGGLRYLPTERAAIAFSICSLIAVILKLAPPCIGGKSMNDCADCATCCWTNTKRQNS